MTDFAGALLLSVGGMYLMAAAMMKASDIAAVESSLKKYRLPGVLGRTVSACHLVLGESILGTTVILSVLSGFRPAFIGAGLLLATTYLSFAFIHSQSVVERGCFRV